MMDGDVVNINVAQSNNNDDLLDHNEILKDTMRTDGLTTINEEEVGITSPPDEKNEEEGADDMERADQPEGEGEEGGDGPSFTEFSSQITVKKVEEGENE
tara:strand:+ start:421 stop:720 length:300 start_codon:yes stop_codon:yes gene_type:complete